MSWDSPASVAPATPLEISLLFDDSRARLDADVPQRDAAKREPPPPPPSAMRRGKRKNAQPPPLPPDVPPHAREAYEARVAPYAANPPSRSPRAPLPSATKPWLAFVGAGARRATTPGGVRRGRGRGSETFGGFDADGSHDARSYAFESGDANGFGTCPTALPRGWIVARGAPLGFLERGLEYYHNVETGESSWTRPASDEYRLRTARGYPNASRGYPNVSPPRTAAPPPRTAAPPPPPADARRRSSSEKTGARGKAAPNVARPRWRTPNDDDERWAAARRRGEAYREARARATKAASPRRLETPKRGASFGDFAAAANAATSEPSARERALTYGERVREREATRRVAGFKKGNVGGDVESATKSPTSKRLSSPSRATRESTTPRRAARAKTKTNAAATKAKTETNAAATNAAATHAAATNAATNAAAIAFQRHFRGRLARKRFAALLSTRHREAANATARERAATAARAFAPSSEDSRGRASLFSGEDGAVAAAIFIQRRFRGRLARKKFEALRRWSLVQSVARLTRDDPAGARVRRDADDAAATLADGDPDFSNSNATVSAPETLVPFEAYISERCAGVKGEKRSVFAGCCGAAKLESAAHLARWSAAPIRDALTVAARDAGKSADAVRMFRAVRAYMGDASGTSRSEKDDAVLQDAVWLATRDAAAMRDEFYCQLCKQTTRHPNAKRELKGWRLMYLVAVAFTPGPELAPYVLSHCRRAGAFTAEDARTTYAQRRRQTGAEREKNHVRLEIAAVATLAATRLAAALAQGSRGIPPGETDTHAAENAARHRAGTPRGEPGDPPVFGAVVEEIILLEELRRREDARRNAASKRADETRALVGTDLGDERDLVDREEAEEREKGASASTTMSTLMTTTPSSDSPLPRPFAALVARLERADARETRGVFRATPPGGDPMSVVPPEIARRFASPKRNANGHYEAVAALCDPTTAAELLKAWLRALALPLIPARMYRGCLESEATAAGMSQALASLPQVHRRMLTATLHAAAAAARAEGAESAEDAASEIAAALTHVVMRPPAAYDGGGADEVRQREFVERMIRMMMTLRDGR